MVPVDRERGGQEEDGDGLPLSDEILLLIITRVAGNTADLVRCAATCRRWRRLVSGDADFICLHAPPRTDRSARGLALGFFHHPDKTQPPRFVPLPSASSSSRLPSLKHLVDGEGRRIFHGASSSRVVACRDGRLVVEIRRPTNGGPLTLCVCNPASGEADVLPCLPGGEAYGCALLTVDDLRYCKDKEKAPPRSASSYRVVLVFDHDDDGYTVARYFCSDAGRWGPSARVIGGRIADVKWRRRWPGRRKPPSCTAASSFGRA
ncbi:hypothetical protein HU200_010844 [Digitaria exilis]|uniref:F-box domain-containing protein n=1 Tax=Digitaria exilis TaxID=1010633 RepID=A0A835FHF3_9POAL|nr:hypothetical protein HU200_010844 [Digitaria exilis]